MNLNEFLEAVAPELAFLLRSVLTSAPPGGSGRATAAACRFELNGWRVDLPCVTIEWGDRPQKGGVQ